MCSNGTCTNPSSASSPSSGSGCQPGCGQNQLCATVNGIPTCLTTCSMDSQCRTCCRSTTDGRGVCAPVQSDCNSSSQSSCPSGQTLVSWNGAAAVCSALCTSNSDCVSGRCDTLSDGRKACAPSGGSTGGGGTGGGGSGSGSGCTYDANCLKWVSSLGVNGMPGCRPNESLLPVMQNVCARSITCDICLPGRRECEKIVPFDPGQSLGGWANFGWCTADRRLEWYCAVDDPRSSKSMITCLRELRGGP